MRLNKYLSECGLCSRREADRLVAQGRVTVNGVPAENGIQITPADRVCVDGREVHRRAEKVYLRFYKPRGIVCTADRREKNNLTEFLDYPGRITYAGRLDRESEGLLLLTDDGDLIDQMMRARNFHEKEYEVTVDHRLDPAFLKTMERGMYLRELGVQTRPCRIVCTGEDCFRVILTQGLNRQIRRMCAAGGYRVRTLKRIRVVNLTLDGLKPGEYQPLTDAELEALRDIVKGHGKIYE